MQVENADIGRYQCLQGALRMGHDEIRLASERTDAARQIDHGALHATAREGRYENGHGPTGLMRRVPPWRRSWPTSTRVHRRVRERGRAIWACRSVLCTILGSSSSRRKSKAGCR